MNESPQNEGLPIKKHSADTPSPIKSGQSPENDHRDSEQRNHKWSEDSELKSELKMIRMISNNSEQGVLFQSGGPDLNSIINDQPVGFSLFNTSNYRTSHNFLQTEFRNSIKEENRNQNSSSGSFDVLGRVSRNLSFQKPLNDKQKKIEEMRQKAKMNLFGDQTDQEGIREINLRALEEDMMSQSQILRDEQINIYHIEGTIEKHYEFLDILGEGTVGLVKKARRKKDNKLVAIKQVRTRDEETIVNIKHEFTHHIQLEHDNIVKVYELYIDDLKGKVYTVMELVQGKEMLDVIHELGHYSENVAKPIFRQILLAIQYMHEHLVCHRDLKPSNILCSDDGVSVKVTDFNVSKFSERYKDYNMENQEQMKHIQMMTYTGTLAYNAPEIFSHTYDESIDMWSAGCILYTMLAGTEPFQAKYVKDLIEKIKAVDYEFPPELFDSVSAESKDLIKKCLTESPSQRITPEEALKHPWFSTTSEKENLIKLNLQANKNLQRRKFTQGIIQEDLDPYLNDEQEFEKFEQRRQKIQASLFSSNVFDILPKRKGTLDLNSSVQLTHSTNNSSLQPDFWKLRKANSILYTKEEDKI